ncbi:TetR/AcrR family transcriptional regulator [Yonghaparkia sp. Soil809]|uniref:TetR/AcrR family transcriptional regulator n=1 Tax=Yonghaparkia sp. Soil809 TaxID=1736417 RepID=UPI0009EC3BD7|nr:TetR/AcrR family transcriptional regulator [Yonghaparkia sp. Soil809]
MQTSVEHPVGAAVSLRERNRRETWSALYEAAASLAEERGPSAVTVDDIASRAGVSKRTFFNYFGTKEDAMLGFREPRLTDAAVAAFRGGDGTLLDRTVALIIAAIHESTDLPSTGGRRLALVRAHPELRGRLDALAGMLESLVAPHIADELATDHVPLDAPAERDPDQRRAAATFMLATTIVRFAYKTDLAQVAAGDERPALDAALDLFRDLLRKES